MSIIILECETHRQYPKILPFYIIVKKVLTKVYTKSVIVLTIVHPRSKVWTIHAPKCEQLFTLQNGNPNLKPPTINNSNGLGKLLETSVYQIRKKDWREQPKMTTTCCCCFCWGPHFNAQNSSFKLFVWGRHSHLLKLFTERPVEKNQMRNKLNMRYN